MSILKSLQTYLTQYDGMELRPIREILTDSADAVGEYALAPTGNSIVKSDIVGNKTYSNSYVLYAKESTAYEADRAENYDFLEGFSEWMENQNEIGNLPILPGRYEALAMEPSNGMLFDVFEDGSGLYQIQLQLKIRKGSISNAKN